MKRIISYIYFLFCRGFFKFYCPLKIQGRENLPPGSFILCSNHASHIDTPVLMLATGLPFNLFGMVAARDYFFDNPWRNKIVNFLMNLIPIDRNVSRATLMHNMHLCKNFIEKRRGHLIIYPEGTRSVTGEIQPFKRGPAMIAQELAMPLIPVYIDGTYRALRKGRWFPRASKISVKIGKPILPHADKKQVIGLLEASVKNLKETSLA